MKKIIKELLHIIIFIGAICLAQWWVSTSDIPDSPHYDSDLLYEEYEDQSGYRFIDKGW